MYYKLHYYNTIVQQLYVPRISTTALAILYLNFINNIGIHLHRSHIDSEISG
jgi:hypothetical protein